MNTYPPERIRNVAVAGHGSSGKTSFVEAALFASGAISRLGKVDDGTATTDFEADEHERKISIHTALAPLEWQDHKINLIDTPGYADFIGETIAALRAADALFLVVDAVAGVQVQTEKALSLAQEAGLPKIVFINRMDKDNADFHKVVDELRESFGKSVTPVEIPIGREGSFAGVVDVLDNKAYFDVDGKTIEKDVPAELVESVADYREKLMEAIAESDDDLLEKYLEGTELTQEEMVKGLKTATLMGLVSPVLCGSAAKTIGVTEALTRVITLLPSPKRRGPIPGADSKSEPVALPPEDSASFSAFVFKTIADPYVGKLSLLRVISGTLKADSTVINAGKGRKEHIGHIFFLRGKDQEETREVHAGDICAVPKLSGATTSDTLAAEGQDVRYPAISFPEPLVSVAVEPKTQGDDEKMTSALARLGEEDPTLLFRRDAITHQSVLSGVGDLHIDASLRRLKKRFNVDTVTSEVKIPYRETIKGKARVQGRYKKQTGGRGQFGDVWLALEPLPRGAGFEFVDKIFGGAVPKNYIPAVEKGVKEVMVAGARSPYPVVDVRVTLDDGSYHPVDSSEMAFKIAASMAFKKALEEANPVILEPVYELEILVPGSFMGDVMGDLSSKRGKILGMEQVGEKNEAVKATVPLAELRNYATELRSITGGRGSYSLSFKGYEEVPQEQSVKILTNSAAGGV